MADDVAQETLLEAWRRLDVLSTPDTFDAWLNAICRNVCRRYARAAGRLAKRRTSLPDPLRWDEDSEPAEAALSDVPDPRAIDLAEEVERQDMKTLLDRALGHLPEQARSAVELCYLAELPQREAALRLGLTIRALEARLHRARKQLRHVLSGALRTEALAFGVALDEDMASGWRETRLWCHECGQCRRQGSFERLPTGEVSLRLRCPGCARKVDTRGLVPLRGMRSFLPAQKRLARYMNAFLTAGVANGWQTCPFCGAEQRVQLVGAGMPGGPYAAGPGLRIALLCGACGEHVDSPAGTLVWTSPAAQRFTAEHPRWVNEPEELVTFQGSPALRVRLADVSSATRLTMLTHPQTLQLLATFQE